MKDDHCKKKLVIEKILNDPIFVSGEYYRPLIQYLFESYQKGFQPTETDIAVHVFGRKDNFNPVEDTLVRVYFYRLRKKLDEYYNGHGKNDAIRLVLPKGHHNIGFKRQTVPTFLLKNTLHFLKFFIFSSFLILIIIIFYLGTKYSALKNNIQYKSHNYIDVHNSVVWSDFVKSELMTTIVIGEVFSFYINKKEYNREWLVRDDQINSYDELLAFINEKKLDKSNIYLPGWDIIPKSAASNLLKIYDVISGRKNQIEIKITSEVSLEDTRNNNIIFIGHFHNLKHLIQYLPSERFHPIVKYTPSQLHPERYIQLTTPVIDTLYQVAFHYDQDAGLNTDYVLVSKVLGPNDNVLLFFVSFIPLGRIETIKMFTDSKLLYQVEQEIQFFSEEYTQYFEMLIEVKGYEEKGFETKIKHFFPLSSKHTINE